MHLKCQDIRSFDFHVSTYICQSWYQVGKEVFPSNTGDTCLSHVNCSQWGHRALLSDTFAYKKVKIIWRIFPGGIYLADFNRHIRCHTNSVKLLQVFAGSHTVSQLQLELMSPLGSHDRHLIERTGGCDDMSCVCGKHFHYSSGIAYTGRGHQAYVLTGRVQLANRWLVRL